MYKYSWMLCQPVQLCLYIMNYLLWFLLPWIVFRNGPPMLMHLRVRYIYKEFVPLLIGGNL